MSTHSLKTWPEYFEAVVDGSKTFEVRDNDRGYRVGDTLLLKEWAPHKTAVGGRYTGREVEVTVTYVLDDGQFPALLTDRCAVLGFRHLPTCIGEVAS